LISAQTHDSAPQIAATPVRQRVIVFIDGQNMYRCARRAFGWEGQPGHYGNFKPIGLGRTVAATGPNRELVQVRIYTGVPTPKHDRRGNSIMQRRMAAWIADSPALVQVFPRPLSYPPAEGREKGVDVELAIDLVRLALDDEYDVGVLASTDTDLVPPIELITRRFSDKTVETIGYSPIAGCEADTAAPLDLPGGGVTRRTITHAQFDRIADRRNFVTGNTDPASVVGHSRWSTLMKRLAPPDPN
jgi:uncharacterized LabA/DUF88 family protein